MNRPFRILCLALFVLLAAGQAYAAPAVQEQRPVIAQPAQDAAVRGVVQIVGTAVHPQFQRYELYYAPSPVPSDQSWIFVGDAHTTQQPLGLLGTWDSRSVPDGAYALRVRVVKVDGNYIDSDVVRVLVANTRPPESPTPEGTATPDPNVTEEPFVPEQGEATPTVEIAVPGSEETPTPEPTPTPGPEDAEPTAILPDAESSSSGSGTATGVTGGSTTSSVESITDQLFNSARLLDVAKTTAKYTFAAFAAIGAFFALKWILVWLWQKIRP
jgi:hypothetical protein